MRLLLSRTLASSSVNFTACKFYELHYKNELGIYEHAKATSDDNCMYLKAMKVSIDDLQEHIKVVKSPY